MNVKLITASLNINLKYYSQAQKQLKVNPIKTIKFTFIFLIYVSCS